MRLPRDISGKDLVKALSCLNYEVTRQTGSHIRLTTQQNGQHHITVPAHDPIKIGTLNSILKKNQRTSQTRTQQIDRTIV